MHELLFLIGFLLLVSLLLSLDLGVFHKKDHVVTFKEATVWTCVWIGVALLFYGFIILKGELIHGPENMAQLQEDPEEWVGLTAGAECAPRTRFGLCPVAGFGRAAGF